MGQEGLWAHFKAKLVSQFLQIKFLSHKNYQNRPKIVLSFYSDCTLVLANVNTNMFIRIDFILPAQNQIGSYKW